MGDLMQDRDRNLTSAFWKIDSKRYSMGQMSLVSHALFGTDEFGLHSNSGSSNSNNYVDRMSEKLRQSTWKTHSEFFMMQGLCNR